MAQRTSSLDNLLGSRALVGSLLCWQWPQQSELQHAPAAQQLNCEVDFSQQDEASSVEVAFAQHVQVLIAAAGKTSPMVAPTTSSARIGDFKAESLTSGNLVRRR
ncbi:MAG: hypothetical protein MI725_09420 [Pirellulales bacterium]|nr:hypothetical protein [Pirellulales bacterium]